MSSIKGPKLLELEQVAAAAHDLATTLEVACSGGDKLELEVRQWNRPWGASSDRVLSGAGRRPQWSRSTSFGDAVLELIRDARKQGALEPIGVSCSSSRSPVKGSALKTLCTAAWYEALGVVAPSEEQLAKQAAEAQAAARARQAESRALRQELLALLAGGPAGVKRWNRRHAEADLVAPFRRADCSGLDLRGARLVSMPEASFTGARLEGADLSGGDFSRARFENADLRKARLAGVRLAGADLTGADLDGADLAGAQLQGAILAEARLGAASLAGALFDGDTRWPRGFTLPAELVWTGKGPSPAALAALEARKRDEGPVDLALFMQRLERSIEKARLSKALGMLKAERFQLFVEVSESRLAGIVKSQSDPNLVYAAALAADGAYGCCTQNLNACGGLRGALCKHLLVLVVGLAQAGEVSADTLDDWVQRSTLHKPMLDREAQSALLIRYKGVEAGEIDWRPTETVPEDFYAY
ncbi:MAG: pentapeptide repeat-containing protein [Vicinamibacteria bacterium]|nr:pentapeptide repeat-containing protein [Vicinamibacteria bacterium]